MNTETYREQKRKAAMSWIEKLCQEFNGELEEVNGTMLLTVKGRKIELWPASDTYYLLAKKQYGVGIKDLYLKMKAYFEKTSN